MRERYRLVAITPPHAAIFIPGFAPSVAGFAPLPGKRTLVGVPNGPRSPLPLR